MVTENGPTPDDKFTSLSADIAEIGRAVSLGQKKEKTTTWSIIGILVAAFSGGSYYVTSVPPRIAKQSDIVAAAKRNPEVFRPDPWTGSKDDDRMRQNVTDRHREQSELLRYVDNRITHKAERLTTLERKVEMLEKRNGQHDALLAHAGAVQKMNSQNASLKDLWREFRNFVNEHRREQ